jgi:hypothetical protein
MNAPSAEQRRHFERLCQLRSLYAHRGPRDATGVLTIAELPAYVRGLGTRGLGTGPSRRAETARSADSTV